MLSRNALPSTVADHLAVVTKLLGNYPGKVEKTDNVSGIMAEYAIMNFRAYSARMSKR